MGKTYYLDLKTLIETLDGQTGLLQRELPKSIGPLNEPCLCSIWLANGQITSCTLTGRSGQQVDAIPLLPSLYLLQTWDVTLTPTAKRQTSPRLPVPTPPQPLSAQTPPSVPILSTHDLLIPYLIVPTNTVLPNTWPHKDRLLLRTVLAQIDGERTIAEIRSRLPLSTELVYQLLNVLSQHGFIRFRKSDEPR